MRNSFLATVAWFRLHRVFSVPLPGFIGFFADHSEQGDVDLPPH